MKFYHTWRKFIATGTSLDAHTSDFSLAQKMYANNCLLRCMAKIIQHQILDLIIIPLCCLCCNTQGTWYQFTSSQSYLKWRQTRSYRLSPVSWSIKVTGIFRSRSSCGESVWRDNSSWWAARRLRASFDLGCVALDLINEEVVVVCTSGTSRELVDDGLADPVDISSFWASLFSFIFTPSSPSSAKNRKKNLTWNVCFNTKD